MQVLQHKRAPIDRGRALFRLLGAVLVAARVLSGPAAFAQDLFAGGEDEGGADPFDITADTVEFDTARQVYIARGNVRLDQPDRELTADWMVFSDITREGVASGNVVVTEGDDKLFADVLHFEVDDLQGIVFQGKLETGGNNFLATGDTIKRTGEQEYVFTDAVFTTCRCPDPSAREPWRIEAAEADLEFGGYAVTKSTTFNVLGVPILWTPRMWWPLKTERQTGFLFPVFNAASRNGFDVGLPFFWAARDNINVLFTPHYLTDNGFKPEGEIEYVFGEKSEGELYGTWIRDDDINENDISTPFSRDRWAVEWLHDHHLPEPFAGWRWKVDGRILSDNNYAFDYRDFSRIRDDRYIESGTFLEGRFDRFGDLLGREGAAATGRYGLTAALSYAEDQQNPDDQDRDDFLLQRFPDLRLARLPQQLPQLPGNAVFSFDTRYTHFWAQDDVTDVQPFATVVDDVFADTGIEAIPDGDERDRFGRKVLPDGTILNANGTVTTAAEILAANPMADPLLVLPTGDGSGDNFPGPEGDGRFQEGEPLVDRGHRFVFNPRLAFPFRVADTFEVMPEIGWHATLYNTDMQSSEFRNLFTALLDVRTRLRRELQLPSWLYDGSPTVHLMEPRFVYTMIEGSGQGGHPLFIPRPRVQNERLRLLEPTNRVRDPSDRIDDVQAVTFLLGNRFYLPGHVREERVGPPRLFADVTLGLHHDFADSDLSSLYLDGVAYPWEGVRTRFNAGFDLDDAQFREMLFSIGYGTPEGNDFRFSYRYVEDVPRFFENFRFDEERFEDFEEGFLEINQFDFLSRIAVTRNWAVTYRLRYSFEQSLALTNQVGVEYVSKCLCWAIRAELEEDRSRGFEFNFRYRILGLGDDTVRPFSRRRRGERDPLIDESS